MPTTLAIELDISSDYVLGWSGDVPEFRRLAAVTIADSYSDAASLSLKLKYRGVTVAQTLTFVASGDDSIGSLSLNTTQLSDVFETRGPNAVVPLTWEVYLDGSLQWVGRLPCKNNPSMDSDAPTPAAGMTPMYKETYDADDDGVIDADALPPSLSDGNTLRLNVQSSDPSLPEAGEVVIFAKADGLYVMDSSGNKAKLPF